MNDTGLKAFISELQAQRASGLDALAGTKAAFAELSEKHDLLKTEHAALTEERDRLKAELETLKPKETTNGD